MTDYVRRLDEAHVPAKRLGRHVRHDPRSRAYPVTAQPTTELRTVFHRRRVPIFDQGSIGSCVGNALAGVLSTAPFVHRYHEPTAVRFYKRITEVDEFPGQYPPDDTGTSALDACKWAQTHGLIGSYLHAFSLDAALTALQTQPVMVGITWLTSCDEPDSEGLVHYRGSVRGGHEIEAVGVDADKQLVWFAQSWGPGWGAPLPLCSNDPGGYFCMSWTDLATALADDGDVTVPQPVVPASERRDVNIGVPTATADATVHDPQGA